MLLSLRCCHSEPINHEGFISLVELNASSTSIPRTRTVLYDTEEKFRALQVISFCHFCTDDRFCPQRCNPHHSCGNPNAVAFTLATHWEARLTRFYIA
jgi:hypothetical protein